MFYKIFVGVGTPDDEYTLCVFYDHPRGELVCSYYADSSDWGAICQMAEALDEDPESCCCWIEGDNDPKEEYEYIVSRPDEFQQIWIDRGGKTG